GVKATLAFANIVFDWNSDEFVDWLNGLRQQSARISPAGLIVPLGSGGISFGPAAAVTATFTPNLLSFTGADACSFDVFGVTSTGPSLSFSVSPSAAESTVIMQASSSFAAPVPSPTPIGPLTSSPGFDTVKAVTTESAKLVVFSSSQAA